MDLRPGIILTVTGILALVVTLMGRGQLPRRAGLITGTMLLVLGVLLLIYAIAFPK